MNFVILNSLMFPVPRTHYLHIKKMSLGFAQLGYYVIETNNLESLVNLAEDDIVYISNHFYVDIYFRLTREIQLNRMLNVLKRTKCNLLLWNFHTLNSDFFKQREKRYLFLTESFYNDHFSEGNLNFYSDVKHYQLIYSSYINDTLENVKTDHFSFDFNYVGSPYNEDILNLIKENKKLSTYIKITPPIVNEIERVNSFRFSKINLVFHSQENKRKGIVTERFAEAMSFGNIIFHDNPRILEFIPKLRGCIYVDNYQDIMDKYNLIAEMEDSEIQAIVSENRTFWKSSPFSYRKQALEIKKLYK